MTEATPRAAPITAARLREWVRGAQPGARLIYARGASCRLNCGPLVADEVQRLGPGGADSNGAQRSGLELVTAHFSRDPITLEGQYLVQRTRRPVPGVGL